MPGDSKENLIFLAVELEVHVYRHFKNQLMLWAVRNSQDSLKRFNTLLISKRYRSHELII